MNTFDIQSVAPEGYEVVGYGRPVEGETFLSCCGNATMASFNFENDTHLILRRKWTPKVGEVVCVRDDDNACWQLRWFDGMDGQKFKCSDLQRLDVHSTFGWDQCRQLTPEERGE